MSRYLKWPNGSPLLIWLAKTLSQEQRLLPRHLSGRGKRPSVRTGEVRAISQREDALVGFRLQGVGHEGLSAPADLHAVEI